MNDIETFKTYLQNGEYDKAKLLVDFILDDESPDYHHQKNLILFMFSIIDELSSEEKIKAYTTISFDVLLNPNDQFRNSIITYILNQQYSKALRLLNVLMDKEQGSNGKVSRFDLVLYELLHALLRKRDQEEIFFKSLYREEKYTEILNYLDDEAKKHRLSRTNSIIRKLLKVYLNILAANEVPVMLPKLNNLDNFNAYFEVHDYYNAYLAICKNAAKARKDFPKNIYLDLLNKINILISKINKENNRDSSPIMEVTTTFDFRTFADQITCLMPQIEREGLIVFEPADSLINKKRKEVIKKFPNLSAIKIGDNLEQLVVLKANKEDNRMPIELMSELRKCYNEMDYQSVILLGKELIMLSHLTVKDLLMIAISYLNLGINDLGIFYLKLAINFGKKLDKNSKDKGWSYWDLENILEYFEEKERTKTIDLRRKKK